MICPHCAFPNDPGTRVCAKCRRPLDQPSRDDSPGQKTPGWFQAPVSGPPASGSQKDQTSAAPMSDKVAACLEGARAKEQAGDLRAAFLSCQSLLIDNYGDIPDADMAALYVSMSRVSAKQDKKERALKYLKKARTLAPKSPEIQKLAEELTAQPPTPIEQAVMQESNRAAKEAPTPPAPAEAEMPTPEEKTDSEFILVEKISAPPPQKPPKPEEPEVPSPEEEPEEEPEDQAEEELTASAVGRLAWAAGFWTRLLAFLIDTLVVTAVVVVMMFISSLVLGQGALEAFDFFFQQLSSLLAAIFVFVILLLVYLTIFTIYGGQTVGKMLLGLRVVGLDGHSVSTVGALRRALGMLVAGLPGLAGFLWTGFDLERRGWHDYIGRTLVVHVQPKGMKAALAKG
jgi:uncharacterized RDD family membrane protein YckC